MDEVTESIFAELKNLKNGSLDEQERAIGKIAEISEPAVLILVRELDHLYSKKYRYATGLNLMSKVAEMGEAAFSLQTNEDDYRNNIGRALVKIGEPAVPALMNALKNGKKELAEHVSRIIFEIGKTAVPALIEMLKDKDVDVRWLVAKSLAEIKDVRAVPALIEALKDSACDVQQMIIAALINIAKKNPENSEVAKGVSALIEMMNDKCNPQRGSAAYALGQIADASTVPALTEGMLDEDFGMRAVCAKSLGSILTRLQSFDAVKLFEKHIEESFEYLGKSRLKKDELAEIKIRLSMLRIETARKKNSLVSKRDILLDDIPKPPRKRGVYWTLDQRKETLNSKPKTISGSAIRRSSLV